jgi:hypothetical protein
MKATTQAWMRILHDVLTLAVESGLEFRTPSGSLLEAPGDIWAELKRHGQVNVQISNVARKPKRSKKNGKAQNKNSTR